MARVHDGLFVSVKVRLECGGGVCRYTFITRERTGEREEKGAEEVGREREQREARKRKSEKGKAVCEV